VIFPPSTCLANLCLGFEKILTGVDKAENRLVPFRLNKRLVVRADLVDLAYGIVGADRGDRVLFSAAAGLSLRRTLPIGGLHFGC
jgi:hypothetical protein